MARKPCVDLYISKECTVSEVYCKSIIEPTGDSAHVALHATTDLDYTKPNDFLCWHCAMPFATPPVPLPVTYEARTGVYHVEGNMCSLACAKAYLTNVKSCDAAYRLLLLKQLAVLCYKQPLDAIVAAPHHTALRAFGGNLNIDEFRASEARLQVLTPPFVPQRCIIKMHHSDDAMVGWSVFNLRRPQAEAPEVVARGERGMYFDYLKQQEQRVAAEPSVDAAAAQPAGQTNGTAVQARAAPRELRSHRRGALENFLQ